MSRDIGIDVVRCEDGGPKERCCFCRAPTDYWTDVEDRTPGEQVACCQRCAANATAAALPSKDVWCEREAIAEGDRLRDWQAYKSARLAFVKRTRATRGSR